jgi:hypothetical protein
MSSEMFATAIIPVGSLRERHYYGVTRLREDLKVDAFVLATTSEKYSQGLYSVLRNANKLRKDLDAAAVPVNPADEVDVAKAFMQIYELQRKKFTEVSIQHKKDRKEKRPERPIFLVDITSTTKVVIKIAFVFAILFGFRPYTVAASDSYTNEERTARILDDLFDPVLDDFNKIKEIMNSYSARGDAAVEDLRQLLQQRTSEIGYELKALSKGVKIRQSQMPVIKPIAFTSKDIRAIKELHKNGNSFDSIKDLAEAMGIENKSEQISLGYRVKKLTDWALVSRANSKRVTEFATEETTRPTVGAKRKIELTPIGTGIAEALENPLSMGIRHPPTLEPNQTLS